MGYGYGPFLHANHPMICVGLTHGLDILDKILLFGFSPPCCTRALWQPRLESANPDPYTHQTTPPTTPCVTAPPTTNPQNLRTLTHQLEVRTPIAKEKETGHVCLVLCLFMRSLCVWAWAFGADLALRVWSYVFSWGLYGGVCWGWVRIVSLCV